MSNYWYFVTILAVVLFFSKKDLRREMLFAGFLALPILIIKPLITEDFLQIAASNSGIFLFFLQRILVSFSFGVVASALYEAIFHKRITKEKRAYRHQLIILLAGPLVFLVLKLFLDQTLIYSIVSALLVDLLIILFARPDLIWDAIFSGFFMGILYCIIFIITERAMPGNTQALWFTDQILGFTIFSVPIEELIAVILFGALWGPIYVAIKDFREI